MVQPIEPTLETVLGGRFLRDEEADAVGQLLSAMQYTEYLLTLAIAVWNWPLITPRFNDLMDNVLMRVPWQDKIKFAREHAFLPKTETGFLQKLFQEDRNFLAHPRNPNTAVTIKYPLEERDKIVARLKTIDEQLKTKTLKIKSELVSHYLTIKNSKSE